MSTHVTKLFNLDGKTALITGGSRGLGLQIAESLGEAGAKVLLVSRKELDLIEAAEHLSSKGISVSWIAADLSKESKIDEVTFKAINELGEVDILINNAGATWGAPAEDYPIDAWDKVMHLNVRSIFLLTQKIAKLSMIPRRQGRIINIASIAGLRGSSTQATIAYGTSKGAVVNFTRTLAGEWGKYGITVNALAPGMFPSKMTKGTLDRVGHAKIADRAPLKRIGDDDDLKGAALLFSSAAGKHITGQILAVDGGITAVLS